MYRLNRFFSALLVATFAFGGVALLGALSGGPSFGLNGLMLTATGMAFLAFAENASWSVGRYVAIGALAHAFVGLLFALGTSCPAAAILPLTLGFVIIGALVGFGYRMWVGAYASA